MDVDFPLLISWLVLITGTIWLLDVAVLRPRRVRAAEALQSSNHVSPTDVEAALVAPRWVEYGASFFPVFLIVLVLRSFLGEPYQIPSESMVPTLEVGDFILVNKYAYGLRLPVLGTKFIDVGEPQRGDIMVFVPPHDPRYFIKRVIGLPGDRIRYERKSLTINGQPIPYALATDQPSDSMARAFEETLGDESHVIYRYPVREPVQEWQVPDGHYFMMGDNRGPSDDSRRWPDPFVPNGQIVGKAVAIWMHKAPGWHLPTFERNRVL